MGKTPNKLFYILLLVLVTSLALSQPKNMFVCPCGCSADPSSCCVHLSCKCCGPGFGQDDCLSAKEALLAKKGRGGLSFYTRKQIDQMSCDELKLAASAYANWKSFGEWQSEHEAQLAQEKRQRELEEQRVQAENQRKRYEQHLQEQNQPKPMGSQQFHSERNSRPNYISKPFPAQPQPNPTIHKNDSNSLLRDVMIADAKAIPGALTGKDAPSRVKSLDPLRDKVTGYIKGPMMEQIGGLINASSASQADSEGGGLKSSTESFGRPLSAAPASVDANAYFFSPGVEPEFPSTQNAAITSSNEENLDRFEAKQTNTALNNSGLDRFGEIFNSGKTTKYVDVYIWDPHDWAKNLVEGKLGSVGHVMITDADSHNVLLSQFPREGTSYSVDRQLSFEETYQREDLPPSHKFRITILDYDKFNASLQDTYGRTYWFPVPINENQTQCTRSAFAALQAGGVFIDRSFLEKNWPQSFGEALDNLSQAPGSGVKEILYSK